MKKIAILFPGQGSQFIGMGEEFYNEISSFRIKFEKVADKLALALDFICFEPNELINETKYAQVAITTISALIYDQVYEILKDNKLYFAGHSLGEFTALYAAKVLDLETMTELVRYRAKIMAEQALITPGSMAAVLGGDASKIEALCQHISDNGQEVQVSNYNLPSQTVISGTNAGLEAFSNRLSETDAKRMIYLKVSGAFHSKMMHEAAEKLLDRMQKTMKNTPEHPVIMNATAKEMEFALLDELISKQLMSPVRFQETIEYLTSQGVDTFVEVGPGNVLSNMIKKLLPEATVISVNKPEDLKLLEAFI